MNPIWLKWTRFDQKWHKRLRWNWLVMNIMFCGIMLATKFSYSWMWSCASRSIIAEDDVLMVAAWFFPVLKFIVLQDNCSETYCFGSYTMMTLIWNSAARSQPGLCFDSYLLYDSLSCAHCASRLQPITLVLYYNLHEYFYLTKRFLAPDCW
jgi:hypothetical protein